MKKFRIEENDSRIPEIWKNKGFSKFELCIFRKSEAIIKSGEILDKIYWVCSGHCAVSIDGHNGKDVIISIFGSQSMIGEIELITNCRIQSNVVALSEVLAVAVPFEEYTQKIETDIELLRFTVNTIASDAANQVDYSARNVLFSAKQRVCQYILFKEKDGKFTENMVTLASYIGVDYRHLTKMFKSLCEEGVLQKEGRSMYRIADRKLLEENL